MNGPSFSGRLLSWRQLSWRHLSGRHLSGRHLVTLGNVAFLVGSVLFLSDASQTAGVWCFIVGSSAFLIGGWTR